MRSCLIVYHYLPHYRYGVFKTLDESDEWDFTFAADADSGGSCIKTIPLEAGLKIKPLHNVQIGHVLWQRGLLCEVMRGRYDAVILLGDASFLTTWLATLLLRCRRIPALYWTIGWHRPDRGLKRLLRLVFYRLPTALLLYGEDARQVGIRMGFPVTRMRVIGNSYESPPSGGPAVATEWTLPEGSSSRQSVYVGAVARLTPLKRFDMLLSACKILRDDGLDVGVILTGDGSEREALNRLANELQVPAVFTGELHEERDLQSVYERLTISVLPERAGLTVMQSLEHGTPVVTVDDPYRQVPEFRAVLPGRTGELYKPDSVRDLAAAIRRCLTSLEANPGKMAANCRRELAERWTPQAHAARILVALSEICAEN